MVTEHRLPVRRACRATGLSRAAYCQVPPLPQEKDAEVIDALNGVVERNGRWGFWKCFDRQRLDGRPWNQNGAGACTANWG
jgi:putative transposase